MTLVLVFSLVVAFATNCIVFVGKRRKALAFQPHLSFHSNVRGTPPVIIPSRLVWASHNISVTTRDTIMVS